MKEVLGARNIHCQRSVTFAGRICPQPGHLIAHLSKAATGYDCCHEKHFHSPDRDYLLASDQWRNNYACVVKWHCGVGTSFLLEGILSCTSIMTHMRCSAFHMEWSKDHQAHLIQAYEPTFLWRFQKHNAKISGLKEVGIPFPLAADFPQNPL